METKEGLKVMKPCKELSNFRNYTKQEKVENNYKLNRTHQTFSFVQKMYQKYQFEQPRALMTFKEALEILD